MSDLNISVVVEKNRKWLPLGGYTVTGVIWAVDQFDPVLTATKTKRTRRGALREARVVGVSLDFLVRALETEDASL
jgi:hypothetical protein